MPALLVRPAAAEDGDTDGEEGHGDDDAGPGGVQGQPRTHAVAVIALVVTVLFCMEISSGITVQASDAELRTSRNAGLSTTTHIPMEKATIPNIYIKASYY